MQDPLSTPGMSKAIETEVPRHRPPLGFETHPEESFLVEDEHTFRDEGEIGGTAIYGDLAEQDPGGVEADRVSGLMSLSITVQMNADAC